MNNENVIENVIENVNENVNVNENENGNVINFNKNSHLFGEESTTSEGKDDYMDCGEYISYKNGITTCIVFKNDQSDKVDDKEEKVDDKEEEEEEEEDVGKVIDLTERDVIVFFKKEKSLKCGLHIGKCINLKNVNTFLDHFKRAYQFTVNPYKQLGKNDVKQNMSVAFITVEEKEECYFHGMLLDFQLMKKEHIWFIQHINNHFSTHFDCITVHRFIGDEKLIRQHFEHGVFNYLFGSLCIFVGNDREMAITKRGDGSKNMNLTNGDYLLMSKDYLKTHFIGISPSLDINNTSFLITLKKTLK